MKVATSHTGVRCDGGSFDPENIGFITIDDAFKCYSLAWKMPSKLEEVRAGRSPLNR